ncbi:hypothetical protein EVAR_43486_1 [Eumeta japonica]|uniref:Uncharacterized protein n=1 Tax=Eumeta variegata TaxID=151549 RepID=A0A4C1YKI1_EUMVA|nr:hypothetical protein EVAR_43486_1 [Eumeta japonica]
MAYFLDYHVLFQDGSSIKNIRKNKTSLTGSRERVVTGRGARGRPECACSGRPHRRAGHGLSEECQQKLFIIVVGPAPGRAVPAGPAARAKAAYGRAGAAPPV